MRQLLLMRSVSKNSTDLELQRSGSTKSRRLSKRNNVAYDVWFRPREAASNAVTAIVSPTKAVVIASPKLWSTGDLCFRPG
jgi:hypothetical protein